MDDNRCNLWLYTTAMPAPNIDTIVSLAKRRGFVFPSSEIYGGLGSAWDYGPLGVELCNNVKQSWWRWLVYERDDIEGIDAAILMHPRVWEASGHVAGFSDPLIECSNCHRRFRADHPDVAGKNQCPVCGKKDTFGEPRMFNLMFKTFMGPVEDEAAVTYCGPRRRRASSSTSTTCSKRPAASFRSASRRSGRRFATRSRRGTSSSGRVSSSRWRSSTS